MTQIRNGFKDFYWLTNDGRVYNSKTQQFKASRAGYNLMLEAGGSKNITAK